MKRCPPCAADDPSTATKTNNAIRKQSRCTDENEMNINVLYTTTESGVENPITKNALMNNSRARRKNKSVWRSEREKKNGTKTRSKLIF